MKKVLALLTAGLLLSASLTACGEEPYEKYLVELNEAYSSEDYLEEQQDEIEAIINDYSEKIKQATDDDERESLKTECIEKMAEIDKKDLAEAKLRAAAFFERMKTVLMPYETSVDYYVELQFSYNYATTAAQINAAIDKMENIVADCSDSTSASITLGGRTFDVTFKCSLDDEGIPVVECKCSQDWASLNLDNNTFFGLRFYAFADGNIKERDIFSQHMVDNTVCQEILCKRADVYSKGIVSLMNRACNVTMKDNMMYTVIDGSNEGAEQYYDDPEQAGFSFTDASTIRASIITKEQLDVIQSDSDTYLNAYGSTVTRGNSKGYSADFITVGFSVYPGEYQCAKGAEITSNDAHFVIML